MRPSLPLASCSGKLYYVMQILLVDDHALIRDALRAILAEVAIDSVVMEADSGRLAMDFIDGTSGGHPVIPDLVILDLGLPDSDGLTLLKQMHERCPQIAVVVLSSSMEPDVMAEALDAGAVGFIPKSAPRAVMARALALVVAGGTYIPPEAWPARRMEEVPVPPAQRPTPTELGLTERQLHVLALLMQGQSNKAIARSLSIAEVTVKHHVTSLMRALKAQNRTEAALMIAQYGWRLPDIG
jgi:DNA-binding NarL/FixJ family response regulator